MREQKKATLMSRVPLATKRGVFFFLLFIANTYAYEISGSPYATQDAPIPEYLHTTGEKFILIDPHAHAWGAYSAQGKLIRWGIATAGADWCNDTQHACHTKTGRFRIYSLGDKNCISHKYPIPDGGAAMPYCMYFNGDQAIHGSNEVQFGNASHGCVRIHVSDAEWLRYNFVEKPTVNHQYQGTVVIIRPYL